MKIKIRSLLEMMDEINSKFPNTHELDESELVKRRRGGKARSE